jgi:hypothetical protein
MALLTKELQIIAISCSTQLRQETSIRVHNARYVFKSPCCIHIIQPIYPDLTGPQPNAPASWAGQVTISSGTVTVQNNAAFACNDWKVTFTLTSGSLSASNFWGCSASNVGDNWTLTPASYNFHLAPGTSTSFGFSASFTFTNLAVIMFSQ